MKIIEREGKSTSAVINNFMNEFDLNINDFKFEILEEGASNFFRLFKSRPAKVRFILPDSNGAIRDFLEQLLTRLQVNFGEIKIQKNDKEYLINILNVPDPGFIIGKDARILDSIQHIIGQIINKTEKMHYHVHLDVNDYRERRMNALLEKVNDLAQKVKKKGKSITLEPLTAANRRLVHQFIEKDGELRTMTVGEGDIKRIVILPVSKKVAHGTSRSNQNR